MAWDGYFEYAGQEFINVARTEAYAAEAGWFRPGYHADDLPLMVGDGAKYISPILDDAPWTDPDDASSYDFWGAYPLSITGIEDSTRSSVVVENINDGGTPGRVRLGTKNVVFQVALLGASDCGVSYGMKWLRRLLLGTACGASAAESCAGGTLCYLDCFPQLASGSDTPSIVLYDGGGSDGSGGLLIDGGSPSVTSTDDADGCDPLETCLIGARFNPEDCLLPLLRHLRNVVFNSGPTVTAKRDTSDGSAVWTVTFTGVAGNPYEFGTEVPVIEGFMNPLILDPYVPGLNGIIDLNGYITTDGNCTTPVYAPVYDPHCPAVVPPPGPPSVPLGCWTAPTSWRRRQFTIPKELIPLWGDVVPTVSVSPLTVDVRSLRLRFYADVSGDGSILDDPCAWCGDIVVSYVPFGSTLVMDGADQSIYLEVGGGGRRRADSLLFGTDGKPFTWPVLSCGFSYIVTLDLPQTQAPPSVDFALTPRVAA